MLNGAGLTFDTGYMECHDECHFECLGRFIAAVEREFELGRSRLRWPWNLKRMSSIDGATELVQEALDHDKSD